MFSKYCVKAVIHVSLGVINPLQAATNVLLAVITASQPVIPTSQPVIHHNNL